MADNEIEDAAGRGSAPQDQGVEIGRNGPVGYAPSAVESTRVRETDLNQQRDPTTRDSSEKT